MQVASGTGCILVLVSDEFKKCLMKIDQSSGEVQLGLWSPDADVETETPRGE